MLANRVRMWQLSRQQGNSGEALPPFDLLDEIVDTRGIVFVATVIGALTQVILESMGSTPEEASIASALLQTIAMDTVDPEMAGEVADWVGACPRRATRWILGLDPEG
jgi:hypothetical protein